MNKAALCLIFTLLTACGFHLRGLVEMPPWLTHVALVSESQANKELIQALQSGLERHLVHIDEPSCAPFLIVLERTLFTQRIVSVGVGTNPRQYQLLLTVHFSLKNQQGDILIPSQEATTSRQLTVNNDRILGSNSEESILMNEMRRDLAVQIITRLSKYTVCPVGISNEHQTT